MQKPGRKIDFLLLGLSRSALRMSFNKPFIFIPFFDLSELLLLGQTSDFLHSYILFTIFIHMFSQGRVSPSGGSLASFFLDSLQEKFGSFEDLSVLVWFSWSEFFTHQKLLPLCHSCWNSCWNSCCFSNSWPSWLWDLVPLLGNNFQKNLPAFHKSTGHLLSVVIPGKTFDPRKVLIPVMISHSDLMETSPGWKEISEHQVATGIFFFFLLNFLRAGLIFPCWWCFHSIS